MIFNGILYTFLNALRKCIIYYFNNVTVQIVIAIYEHFELKLISDFF